VVIEALRNVTLAQMLAPPPAKPKSEPTPAKRIDLHLANA